MYDIFPVIFGNYVEQFKLPRKCREIIRTFIEFRGQRIPSELMKI